MRNIWTVARRELGAIFVQPIAYVVAVFITLFTGYLFAGQLTDFVLRAAESSQFGPVSPPTADQILLTFNFVMIFFAPAFSMRLVSEELKSGTMELLMTLPVRDGQVVLGKWLAALLFYLSIVALTLVYPLVLVRFGNPDLGPIVSAYLGVLLWGGTLLAIGVLASALTEDQISAFMIAVGINLLLYLMSIPADLVTTDPRITTIFTELSLRDHQTGFMSGLITAKDVLYFVCVSAVFLFAAARVLESRRWR
jgi:ABC-2 type transport system permease protein